MKKILSVLLLCCTLFAACGDKDSPEPDKPLMINARVVYSKWGEGAVTYPDAGAKLYVFYGANYKADGYTYQPGGKFVKAGQPDVPFEQEAVIGSDGKVTIDPLHRDRSLVVVAECAYYKKDGQFETRYYDKLLKEHSFVYIFDAK